MTAALPAEVPAARLLGCYDDGEWVALVLEDIQGRHPTTPWVPEELDWILTVLKDLAGLLTPPPLPDVESAADFLAENFGGWHRIAADPPTDLHPWTAQHLDELRRLAEQGLAALTGDTLVHTDIRADNILLSPQGRITIVDWPWACRGPAWLDTLLLLINARLYGR